MNQLPRKHIYQVTYRLGKMVFKRLVLASSEVYAWIEVFRSHYKPCMRIEVKLWERF